jgi:predicted nucleic acid-binding protein
VIAADTSVVIAALAGWHEAHEAAAAAMRRDVRLPGHCLIEAYSVLTRLPAPHRVEPRLARDLLHANFTRDPLILAADAHGVVLDRLVDAGVSGGGAYDGLIALTAAQHDVVLLTRDQRAVRVYAALGVRYELVG